MAGFLGRYAQGAVLFKYHNEHLAKVIFGALNSRDGIRSQIEHLAPDLLR